MASNLGRGICALLVASTALAGARARAQQRVEPRPTNDARTSGPVVHDAHLHLTNYVQQGPTLEQLLSIMGAHVGRAAVFGMPLQQLWSARMSGDYGPHSHLSADSSLYYYSFTDAVVATAYKSLSKAEQARFDPLISGFNPADMYAADHIRRVLETFPGVFSGVGEITIHREFVSSKIAGEGPSLLDPALDRVLDFCSEVGLVVLMHNDVDVAAPRPDAPPAYFAQMNDLLLRHPRTTIIWAHLGLGRLVQPITNHVGTLDAMLSDPAFAHVYFDISSSDVAKYALSSIDALQAVAQLINRHPDRFLFGSDEVAPQTEGQLLELHRQYEALWAALTPDTRERVRKGNYERLFDDARKKVRAWEQQNARGGNRALALQAMAANPQPAQVQQRAYVQPAAAHAPSIAVSQAASPPVAVSQPQAPQPTPMPGVQAAPSQAPVAQAPAMTGAQAPAATGPAQPMAQPLPQPAAPVPQSAPPLQPAPTAPQQAMAPPHAQPPATPPTPTATPQRMVGAPPPTAPSQSQPAPWPVYQQRAPAAAPAPPPHPQPQPYRPEAPAPQAAPRQPPVRVVSQAAP